MVTLESSIGNYITLKNKRYSYFAGNNYLGLANHPALIEGAVRALKTYGTNFSASRQTTGTSVLHIELEKLLSEFKGRQDAVAFATGYVGNNLLFEALKEEYTAVFADSMSHPSVLDGIPREVTKIQLFNHCNTEHLGKLLKKSGNERPLIITDGIFALTGEIAPLDEIYALAKKHNAILIVDDAHATGILGATGKGTPEHYNLEGANHIYQSETMSKAFGAYGGFISSEKKIIGKIRSTSRFVGGSTAVPPPIVAAGIAALKLIKEHPELRQMLKDNIRLVKNGIRQLDFPITDDLTPIIPVVFRDKQNALALSDFLEKNNIIAPCIDYPVKMDKLTVRITVSASHTKEQIENLIHVLTKWRDRKN